MSTVLTASGVFVGRSLRPLAARRRSAADGDLPAGAADAAVHLRLRRRDQRRPDGVRLLRRPRGSSCSAPGSARRRARSTSPATWPRGRSTGSGRCRSPPPPSWSGTSCPACCATWWRPAWWCWSRSWSATGRRPASAAGSARSALIALWILAVTALFVLIGLVAGIAGSGAPRTAFIFLFLPYVSSAFVPAETLPTWLRGFAEHQPITPGHRVDPGAAAGRLDRGPTAWWAVAWSLLILVVPAF